MLCLINFFSSRGKLRKLLDEIKPDYVHVMADGQIIKTGESDLALELEKHGYEWTDNFLKEK